MNNNGNNGNKTTKKNVSVLGLAPLQGQATDSLGLAPYNASSRAITRQEERIVEKFHEEELIIDLTGEKSKFGMRKIGEVHQYAAELFGDTVSHMLDVKNDARGTDAQPFVDEFTMRQIQMYARQMFGALDITGVRIGEEIYRSLNLPPEQLGFWQRLLGRK